MMKMTSIMILVLGVIFLSPKSEQIALSNLCSNKVKREVRSRYSYNKEWVVIGE